MAKKRTTQTQRSPSLFSHLPKIGRLLEQPDIASFCALHSREYVVRLLRRQVEFWREEIVAERVDAETLASVDWSAQLQMQIDEEQRGDLRRVINATGVILHTNLGRAPLCQRALEQMERVARGYSNLEYELSTRQRGGRMARVRALLCELTGAEDALVVNNNAAATMLALGTMAAGKEVVISRGELVEIGGSFRVPEVMEAAGAKLREVGTTNRTHLFDYERAIHEDTALLLKVHQSNYVIRGFTKAVEVAELVALGKAHGLPVMVDEGCGYLSRFKGDGSLEEPLVGNLLRDGVDLVTFSGDKLLGGPQAGMLVGRRDWIRRAAKQPIARALRVDKLTLAALEATLQVYVEGEAAISSNIPVVSMMQRSMESLLASGKELRAKLVQELGPSSCLRYDFEEASAAVGGGSLPEFLLPTLRLAVEPRTTSAEVLERWLRERELPIVALLDRGRVLFDLRTLTSEEQEHVVDALVDFVREKREQVRFDHEKE